MSTLFEWPSSEAQDSREGGDWEGWQRRRRVGRKRVSWSLSSDVVRNLTEAWWFARNTLDAPLNRFLSIRPEEIDRFTPQQRSKLWPVILNKLAQFARDHSFTSAYIWARESARSCGSNEHLHVLIHIPPARSSQFASVLANWFHYAQEIDMRPAHYRTHRTGMGSFGMPSVTSRRTRLRPPGEEIASISWEGLSLVSAPDAPSTLMHQLGHGRKLDAQFGANLATRPTLEI